MHEVLEDNAEHDAVSVHGMQISEGIERSTEQNLTCRQHIVFAFRSNTPNRQEGTPLPSKQAPGMSKRLQQHFLTYHTSGSSLSDAAQRAISGFYWQQKVPRSPGYYQTHQDGGEDSAEASPIQGDQCRILPAVPS